MTNRRDFLKDFLAGGITVVIAPGLLRGRTTLGVPSKGNRSASAADGGWEQVPEILKRMKPPVFPDRDFQLINFGAVGDGRSDCTDAFRKAIAECNKAGGGRVVVPTGSFLTGAIHLKSDVNLHVAAGATIKFTRDTAQYLPVVLTRWEGVELMNYSPFIYALGQKNIAISGEGTLDGQADCEHWWPWKGRANCGWKPGDLEQSAARKRLFEMAERSVPVVERIFGEASGLRPQFIQPYRCQNVLIEGITIRNSPMWEIHPVLCTNVTVRGVSITSHGPNNDGCDPESCRDVLIEDCSFDTGDDCIAIKSGRNADGRRVGIPSENIVIRRCQMKDGHGGVTIGSEISGGVRNVFAENCRLDSRNLDHALRVKNNAMRGGLLENLYFRNIRVGQVAHAAITIDFNYEEGEKGPFTPVVRNVVVNDLRTGKSRYALDVQGLKQAPIYQLRLEDCSFDNVTEPNILRNVEDLTLTNVRINGNLVENERQGPKIKIVLVGDSTVTDKDGWGRGFADHLAPNVECINLAKGGRSSKSNED